MFSAAKRKRQRAVGLLGVALPDSSEDEDYAPPARAGATAPGRRQRQSRQPAEEDVPLAQRRRQLQQRQSGTGGAQAAGRAVPGAEAAAPAGPAGPAVEVHLPEAVLCHILRLACAPANGGAIPTAAAGAPRGGCGG